MAATKEEIKELAEHIYDLDAEVYRTGVCLAVRGKPARTDR